MHNPESSSAEPRVYDVRRRGEGFACDIEYKTNRLTIATDATGKNMIPVALTFGFGKIPTIEELENEQPATLRTVQKAFDKFKETTQ